MVDPVSILDILKTIYELGNKIKEQVETIRNNREECARLLDHIRRVSAIVKWLQHMLERKTIRDGDGHQMLSDAFKALKETLERGHEDIVACKNKGRVRHFFEARSIAQTLHEIGDNISKDMGTATLATVLCIYSLMDDKTHADIKKDANAYSARDTASRSSRLPSLSKQKVEALPDLPPEVMESVQIYCPSIPYDGNQNNDRRKANNKREDHHSSGKVSIEKTNVPAERRASRASLSDGSASKSASKKSVAGQGGPTSNVKVFVRPCPPAAASSRPAAEFPSTRTPPARSGRTAEKTSGSFFRANPPAATHGARRDKRE